jgi:microcompartment protein CcmL/EutN
MNALGMIETMSIPAGVRAGDAMLKAAAVSLVTAQAVCAGKYIVLVSGEVAAVKSAVEAGVHDVGIKLVDSMLIPSVDSRVIAAISGVSELERVSAIGVLETFSLAAAVYAADTAVKAAAVELIEIRLARGMGGKSFILLSGDVAAVEAAVRAAENCEAAEGMISQSVVIPSPHPDMVQSLL